MTSSKMCYTVYLCYTVFLRSLEQHQLEGPRLCVRMLNNAPPLLGAFVAP